MVALQPRTYVWTSRTIPIGLIVLLLGLWAALVPLVGPYFGFGFDTDNAWVFSEPHWTLSIIPGLAAAAGGFILMAPRRGSTGLGDLLATAAGIWLLVGPSLHALWASGSFGPDAASDTKRAVLWIAYFYGVGALITLLAGYSEGLVTRRQRIEETMVAEPQFERTVTEG